MELPESVAALAALAQGTRLRVFRLLVRHGGAGLAAGDIAATLEVAPTTMSFHLNELAHAGLVQTRHEGRFIYYSANPAAMNGLLAFLTENCCGGEARGCAPATATAAPLHAQRPRARA